MLETIQTPQEKTMTHIEIAEFTNSRRDNVKRAIERLENQGVIAFTPMEVTVESTGATGKQSLTEYHVNEEDSYIVVAQIDAKFCGQLVKRWRALESGQAMGANALPDSFICGDAALVLEYGLSAIAGLPEINAVTKTFKLADDFVLKKFTINGGGSTYKKMPAWVFDLVEQGFKRIIFVTNADNPHIKHIKAYTEKMIKLTQGHCRICLITDKFSTLNVQNKVPSQLALNKIS